MNYKVEGALRKNKKYFIIFGILWLFIAIVLIVPWTLGVNITTIEKDLGAGISKFVEMLFNPIAGINELISNNLMQPYLKNLGIVSIFYAIFFIIGIARSAPKNEFTDFEHGSSDWSKNGEQYQILSNKKGIILAEDNYLPVDKRGNVNVLVVGGSGSRKICVIRYS